MKTEKKIGVLAVLTVFGLVVGLSGFGLPQALGGPLGGLVKGKKPDFIGTWEGVSGGNKIIMELRKDSTIMFGGQQGTYNYKTDQLIINIGGESGTYGMKTAGDTLTLTGADLGGAIMFKRLKTAQPAASQIVSCAPFYTR